MTAEKLARTCDECKFDGGWHYDDDGNASRCPNRLMAEQLVQARELTAKQVTAATAAAREIVKDAAERLAVFSANDLRDEVENAQIVSSGTMGNAFSWACRQNWIEWTGRMVPSKLENTHGHPLHEWRSLVYRRAA